MHLRRDQTVTSETEVTSNVEVVPLCLECTTQTANDPSYLARCMDAWARGDRRPMLRLIPGKGKGDHQPRGRLTIVDDDRDDKDPAD
jgi:hypothetical protein